MVLVGNKCHLTDQRVITTEEGEDLARKFGCPFFEASSKTGVNVDQIFLELVRQINRQDLQINVKTKGKTLNDGVVLQMLKHPSRKYTYFNHQCTLIHCM